MGHLLLLAHFMGSLALLLGARAWLRAGSTTPTIPIAPNPSGALRYRAVIEELAALERRHGAGELDEEEFQSRRKALLEEALRLRQS